MKKALKVILTVPLLLALVVSPFISNNAYALASVPATQTNENPQVNAPIQKDDAVQIIETKINIPEGYELESINFNNNYWNGVNKSAWNLYYVQKENERYLGSLNITIDSEDGTILMIDSYRNTYNESKYPAKVSIEEAQKIADQYIADLYPEVAGKFEVDENYLNNYKPNLSGPINYYFNYRYTLNDIPLDYNSIGVSVDGNGIVNNFHYNYIGDITYEEPVGIISEEEILKKYDDSIELGLSYVFPYQFYYNNNTMTPFIAYNSSTFYTSYSATTGDLYDPYNAFPAQGTTYKKIVDQPLTSPNNTNGKELTQDEVLNLAKEYLAFLTKDTIEINDISYNSNDYNSDTGIWYLSWHTENAETNLSYYGSMNIDAITGEVKSYYYDKYNYYYEKEAPEEKPVLVLNYEQAETLAIEAVKKLAPSKAYDVSLQVNSNEITEGQERQYFYFTRLVHDIPSGRENIWMSVNLVTGEISDFNTQWGNVTYPEQLPELIPTEEAENIFLEKLDLELVYTIPYSYNPYNTEDATKEAKLVYRPVNSYAYSTFLDAVTGEWRYTEDGSLVNKVKPTDIEGHWAENELQLMLDFKALELDGDKILPNQNITRGELVKMFLLASNGGNYYPYYGYESSATFTDVSKESPYFVYVEDAVRRNLITVNESKEFDPEGEVTREELAVFVVKALGYDKLAGTDGLFSTTYKDQTDSEYPGHIAIVSSLNIMKGDGTNFYPDKTVTRATAAVTFYRYLHVRNDYQENSQYYYYY